MMGVSQKQQVCLVRYPHFYSRNGSPQRACSGEKSLGFGVKQVSCVILVASLKH